MADTPRSSLLPSLGKRGGGWVLIQGILIWVLVAAGVRGKGDLDGPQLLLSFGVGVILIALGTWLIFSGVRGLRDSVTPMPKPADSATLIVDGIYSHMRHPIYLGLILVGFGWSVAMDSLAALIVATVLAVFYDLKARREEAWLRERYPDYAAYARTTKRFVPYVY
jgi:protein-S-isoprenylcysteine O-methyltransferase Ste14